MKEWELKLVLIAVLIIVLAITVLIIHQNEKGGSRAKIDEYSTDFYNSGDTPEKVRDDIYSQWGTEYEVSEEYPEGIDREFPAEMVKAMEEKSNIRIIKKDPENGGSEKGLVDIKNSDIISLSSTAEQLKVEDIYSDTSSETDSGIDSSENTYNGEEQSDLQKEEQRINTEEFLEESQALYTKNNLEALRKKPENVEIAGQETEMKPYYFEVDGVTIDDTVMIYTDTKAIKYYTDVEKLGDTIIEVSSSDEGFGWNDAIEETVDTSDDSENKSLIDFGSNYCVLYNLAQSMIMYRIPNTDSYISVKIKPYEYGALTEEQIIEYARGIDIHDIDFMK